MLINAQLRNKQEEIQTVGCDIACVVELPSEEFYDFKLYPLADRDFIKEHLHELETEEPFTIPCLLVLGAGTDDGILVDPQGYSYARYTAYIPRARQLLHLEEVEKENLLNDEADSIEALPSGMTL